MEGAIHMFVLYNEKTTKPIKVWLDSAAELEEGCLEQAYHLANLPFVYKWVALMPDTHRGMGMPIGGVIAAEDTIVPNAVGVDIGCGMAFAATNIPVAALRETLTDKGNLVEAIVGDILRSVPVGFRHHKRPQHSYTLDKARQEMDRYENQLELRSQIEAGYYQIGTLGGGNHFIELQEDDDGMLGVMLHSGSRNFGKQVCDFFHHQARELNEKWHVTVPDHWRLAFLPVESDTGKDYIAWMQLALDFAAENRAHMLLAVKAILEKWIGKHLGTPIAYSQELDCHHNYAALENHFGKPVWVHRKGATRAEKGELAVIPGAMGSYSYVVEGLGNADSFHTSSHGAGRRFSRSAALKAYSAEQVMQDLSACNVVLGKHKQSDVAEESRFAYKDIDAVMDNQKNLVRPVRRLRTVGVVKG